jgi:hypothetical protein
MVASFNKKTESRIVKLSNLKPDTSVPKMKHEVSLHSEDSARECTRSILLIKLILKDNFSFPYKKQLIILQTVLT